jgi:triosephosphate isomerase
MHGSRADIRALLTDLRAATFVRAEVMVFPPALYLAETVTLLAGSGIAVGAQNIHAEALGAFTGEIAAEMVRDVGGSLVLVGHSERRALFGESNAAVADKFRAAQRAGLVPILCVGETLPERSAGQAQAVVLQQLDAVVEVVGIEAFAAAMIAYEPVWAIGTGRTAAPADAQAMHELIRARLMRQSAAIGGQIRILYGGSVKAANAGALFAQPDVDGGLVGGASLDAAEFARIGNAA